MQTIEKHFHSNSQERPDVSPQPVSNKTLSTQTLKWSALISQWEQSGQTKMEFCRLHGLNYNTFTYHYGKASKRSEKCSKLLPVKTHSDNLLSLPQSMPYFTLHFPNGIRLTIPEYADPSTLKVLLSILGEQ